MSVSILGDSDVLKGVEDEVSDAKYVTTGTGSLSYSAATVPSSYVMNVAAIGFRHRLRLAWSDEPVLIDTIRLTIEAFNGGLVCLFEVP